MGEFEARMRQALFGALISVNKGAKTEARSEKGETSMFSTLAGAVFRALLMVGMVAIPSFVLPATPADTGLMSSFLALCIGVLTFLEYNARAPSFVEFRDAPPFNRMRFATLVVILFVLSLILRDALAPSTLSRLTGAFAASFGAAMDFPFSPVRLFLIAVPEGTAPALRDLLRMAAGTAYLLSLIGIAVFFATIRLSGWPCMGRSFNLWINLPTFEPAANGDILGRLGRDSALNMVAGFLLPFALPALAQLTGALGGPLAALNAHSVIWIIAGWAFLPAALFMRGLALAQLARSIAAQRALETGAQNLDERYSLI